MTNTKESTAAIAEMLIRKPVSEIFNAFVNPEITTKFWFTKSTGKLEAGKKVDWIWEMYNHTEPVLVKSIVPDETIIIEWGAELEKTTVEWSFKQLTEGSTFVSIVNSGFKGNSEQLIPQIRDSTGGFTIVLAGLKAYLEHGIQLNLIADRFPEGI